MIPFIAGASRFIGLGKSVLGGSRGGRGGRGGFKMSASAEMDRGSLEKFRRQFGETSDQALLRLSLNVSKNCAFYTQPRGMKKKKIVDAIDAGARRNIIPLKAPDFKRHAKTNNPSHFMNGRWYPLHQDQILRDEEAIWDFIEKYRKGNRGRVKGLPPGQKAICKAGDLNKVVARRKKLAGVMKGSWFGSFSDLSRKVKGGDRPRLGKNYMYWAQRHKNKGRGLWVPGGKDKSETRLISRVPGTLDKKYFNQGLADEAIKAAWRKTIAWYRKQCKLKFEGKGKAA